MPYNGSGSYSLPAGNPVVTGSTISSTTHNNTMSDIASALTNAMTKDGQSTPTANLKMGGFKHTGLGTGSAATDSTNLGQVQGNAYCWLGTGGGTADVITASASPSLTAYAAGQVFRFLSSGANTTNVTLNIDVIGAKAVTKNGATALAAGDIPSGALCEVVYDGTRFQLLNVAPSSNFTSDVTLSAGKNIVFEGTTDDAFEGTLSGGDPTADRTWTMPDKSGTFAITSDIKQIAPITASVSSNALTLTLNPCQLDFRSATLGSGAVNQRTVGSAVSLTISSGSTMGTVNGQPSRIALLAIDNAGTVELAAVNLAGGTNLDETGLISTTAEGGAGAADSAATVYSQTARTNVPYRVVGYVESTQATAGTWATAPSTIQGCGGQALASLQSLGYGQTWTGVTRSPSTTYYNTTGKPITFSAYIAPAATFQLTVSGASLSLVSASSSVGAAVTYVIPAGASYSFAGGALVNAFELR